MQTSPRIVVVGSINMDLVVRCAVLPIPGETILAYDSAEVPGGKGANQAVAAARQGARVAMIAKVGDDSFANRLRLGIEAAGIDSSQVTSIPNCASGIAIIGVEDSGQNHIMVVPNANGKLSPDDIDVAAGFIRAADLLLVQLEVPLPAVLRAITIARAAGVRTVLNPAPAPALFPDALFDVDLICPNQSEAATILNISIESRQDARLAAQAFVARGSRNAVITMGHDGVVVCSEDECHWIEPFKVDAVDTTAAGDAFAAAVAIRWCETGSIVESVKYAAAAGAYAASRFGAQPSMPSRSDIDSILQRDKK